MMPNIVRGGNPVGLMFYLFGPGRHNEHADQHLVAGSASITYAFGFGALGREQITSIGRELAEPAEAFGVSVRAKVRARDPLTKKWLTDPVTGKPVTEWGDGKVWHTSLALKPEEGRLSDEKWGAIATAFIDKMGFGETGGKAPCRWVAVRHGLTKDGGDHIHLAVSVVRDDGSVASVHNDRPRSQRVANELEHEFGLMVLESREAKVGERGEKPAERARAVREGSPVVSRRLLEGVIRAAAAQAENEAEFVRLLRKEDILVRPRYATGRTDVVVGFSVATRPVAGETTVWYGGGKLARDLTLPRLREGWADTVHGAQAAVDEWRNEPNPWILSSSTAPLPVDFEQARWVKHTQEMQELADRLASVPVDDPSAWAHVARDTAGVFFSWSRRLEKDAPGPLADAGRHLARAAHIRAYQSKPKPVEFGSMAGAAQLFAAASITDANVSTAVMVSQLMRLGYAVAGMHAAAGDAATAATLRSSLATVLNHIHAQMPAPAATALLEANKAQARTRPVASTRQPVFAPSPAEPAPVTVSRERAMDVTERVLRQAEAWAAQHVPAVFEQHQVKVAAGSAAEVSRAQDALIRLWQNSTNPATASDTSATSTAAGSDRPVKTVEEMSERLREAGVHVRTWSPGLADAPAERPLTAAERLEARRAQLRSRVKFPPAEPQPAVPAEPIDPAVAEAARVARAAFPGRPADILKGGSGSAQASKAQPVTPTREAGTERDSR